MNQAVAKREEPSAQLTHQLESSAVLSLIERAAKDPQIDIDKMQRLLDMRAQEAARAAKVSYSAALSAMQVELPVIERRGTIGIAKGDNAKKPKYALWEDINEAIKPVLAKHGFALSFRCGRDADKIMVTSILSHRDGHSEETTMLLPIDTGPGRNAVQSIGSSTSYGKRYTAAALLNLTSRGEDDDGATAPGGFVTEEQAEAIKKLIVEVGGDIPKFLKVFKIGKVEELPAARFQEAKDRLEAFGQSKQT